MANRNSVLPLAANADLGKTTAKVVLVLCLLRAILKVPVVDRFRVAYVIDPHNHWVHASKRGLTLVRESGQGDTHSGEHKNRNLEIGIHYQWIAVLFQVTLCGAGDSPGGFRFYAHRFCAHFDLFSLCRDYIAPRIAIIAKPKGKATDEDGDAGEDGIEEIERPHRPYADDVEQRTFYAQVGERLMQALEDSICAMLLLCFVWHKSLA